MPLLSQNHCVLFGLIPSLGISLPCERSRSLLGLMPCLCYSSLRPRVGCGYLASKEPRLALFGFHFLTAVFTVSRCGVHALHRLFSLAVVVPFSGCGDLALHLHCGRTIQWHHCSRNCQWFCGDQAQHSISFLHCGRTIQWHHCSRNHQWFCGDQAQHSDRSFALVLSSGPFWGRSSSPTEYLGSIPLPGFRIPMSRSIASQCLGALSVVSWSQALHISVFHRNICIICIIFLLFLFDLPYVYACILSLVESSSTLF